MKTNNDEVQVYKNTIEVVIGTHALVTISAAKTFSRVLAVIANKVQNASFNYTDILGDRRIQNKLLKELPRKYMGD